MQPALFTGCYKKCYLLEKWNTTDQIPQMKSFGQDLSQKWDFPLAWWGNVSEMEQGNPPMSSNYYIVLTCDFFVVAHRLSPLDRMKIEKGSV